MMTQADTATPIRIQMDTLFYLNNVCNMARARVAETGQRRRLEGPVTQVFVGSNPSPRIQT